MKDGASSIEGIDAKRLKLEESSNSNGEGRNEALVEGIALKGVRTEGTMEPTGWS